MKISSRNIFTFQLNLMDPLFGVRKLTFAKQFAFFFGETHLTNSGFSSFPYPKPDPHELIASMFVVVNTGGWRTHVPPNMSSSNIMTSHRKTSKLTQKKKPQKAANCNAYPPPHVPMCCFELIKWVETVDQKTTDITLPGCCWKEAEAQFIGTSRQKKTEVVITSWRLFWWLMVLVRYKFDKNRG